MGMFILGSLSSLILINIYGVHHLKVVRQAHQFLYKLVYNWAFQNEPHVRLECKDSLNSMTDKARDSGPLSSDKLEGTWLLSSNKKEEGATQRNVPTSPRNMHVFLLMDIQDYEK